jgi:PAS domain-containing protein
MANSSLLLNLFHKEPAGRFALGYIFLSAQNLPDVAEKFAANEVGSWHCDLTDQDRLTWSERVYELFGFPAGSEVEREQAVARYEDHSRSVLDRVREFAIARKYGFILDAAIRPEGKANQWIRILAFPIIRDDRVVALHGVKRAL